MPHPWSEECLGIVNTSSSRCQVGVEKETCTPDSKGYRDINIEEYQVKETVLVALITIMLFGGILAVLSNAVVLVIGLKKRKIFPAPILSLAFTDLLSGLLVTPLVIAIYYTSEHLLIISALIHFSQSTPDIQTTGAQTR
jgi:hypothetical protein